MNRSFKILWYPAENEQWQGLAKKCNKLPLSQDNCRFACTNSFPVFLRPQLQAPTHHEISPNRTAKSTPVSRFSSIFFVPALAGRVEERAARRKSGKILWISRCSNLIIIWAKQPRSLHGRASGWRSLACFLMKMAKLSNIANFKGMLSASCSGSHTHTLTN